MQNFLAVAAREIRQLSDVEFWLAFAISTAITAYLFWRMACWYQHGRLIENIPTARVRSAPQGYIELIGVAKMMEGLLTFSPLSHTRCVWYSYKIEEKVREYDAKGRSRTRWRVVKQATSEEVFMLQDETGECAIDPDDAEVITRDKQVWYEHGAIPPRRYTEWTIIEGEPLYAMGLFKSVSTAEDQTIRQQVSHLLREWKQDQAQLLSQYDTDHDGQISEPEWQQVRQDATLAVKRNIAEQAKKQRLSILSSSPHRSQPYIISTVPEKELVARYHRKSFAAMFGFITLGVMIVWAFNQRFLA